MTARQLAERNVVMGRLGTASWSLGQTGGYSEARFQNNKVCIPVLVMVYQNDNQVRLAVNYDSQYQYLMLELYHTSVAFRMVVYFKGQLDFLLNILTQAQAVISEKNYKTFVQAIVEQFPDDTYLEKENNFIQLTIPTINMLLQDKDDKDIK